MKKKLDEYDLQCQKLRKLSLSLETKQQKRLVQNYTKVNRDAVNWTVARHFPSSFDKIFTKWSRCPEIPFLLERRYFCAYCQSLCCVIAGFQMEDGVHKNYFSNIFIIKHRQPLLKIHLFTFSPLSSNKFALWR